MRFRIFIAGLGACVLLLVFAAAAEAHRLSGHPKTLQGKLRLAKRQLLHDRHSSTMSSSHWTLMSPLPVVAFVHRWWLARDRAYVKQLVAMLRPPHYQQWLCIHRFEGAWNDPNPPYYGGLQMDLGFQRTYGRTLLETKGTADHWTPLEQMWVAERAHRTRGFWPWPNTARYCGLL